MTDKSKELSGEDAQPTTALPMPEYTFQQDVTVVHDGLINNQEGGKEIDLSNLVFNFG